MANSTGTGNVFLDILLFVVKLLIGNVTPALLDLARNWVKQFREQAKSTENAWDDVLADFLCKILGVD